jgi:hypothetical protein
LVGWSGGGWNLDSESAVAPSLGKRRLLGEIHIWTGHGDNAAALSPGLSVFLFSFFVLFYDTHLCLDTLS